MSIRSDDHFDQCEKQISITVMTIEGICISQIAATVLYPKIVIVLLIVHFCSHSGEGDFVLVITPQCNCLFYLAIISLTKIKVAV